MELEGVVQNGVIVVASQDLPPEGTKVKVLIKQPGTLPLDASSLGEALLKHAGKAQGLPEDSAAQHDHYLYGTPKR